MITLEKRLIILFSLPILAHATPVAPSALELKALSATTVSIKWKDNSTDESGFKIFRKGKLIHTTASNIEAYIDSGLTASTTYEYEVKATNSDEVKHVVLENSIVDGNDDVEERADGSISNTSSDLELTQDSGQQTIGLRFQLLSIPKDAVITKAYIQFTTDEISSGTSNLTIYAEDTSNAPAFTQSSHAISSKTLTSSHTTWTPLAWNSIGEHATAQKTSDLSAVVQEIVNKADWQNGNALTFIIKGTGKRVADSYNGSIANAPKLHIEYDTQVVTPPPSNITGLVINEVLTANATTNLDPDFYQFSDWIELYNGENNTIDISGFYLSDDIANPTKYKIPNGTTITSHAYLLIWADEENKKAKAIHTNFKLSQKGETLTLADKSGTVIDTIVFKKQDGDISCAKVNDTIVYMSPTPNIANAQIHTALKRVKRPTFSLIGGGYNGTQTITLSQENGGVIYYTLDGKMPNQNSSIYGEPINISQTTVIKAIATQSGFLPSKVKTESYFIAEEDISLPIVSLSMDNKYLYNDTVGIYIDGTNGAISYGCYSHKDDAPSEYRNFNQDWERPVSIEYFETNGTKAFEVESSLSIAGQCSRYHRKKPFTLKMNEKYGDKSLKYVFYSDKPSIKKVKSFKLRAGASSYGVEDILASSLAKDGNFNLEYQSYKAIQMFMNGKYWGIYNIREKKGKDFLKTNHPEINKNNIDVIARTFHGDVVKKGNKIAFDVLDNYVSGHDLSSTINYNQIRTMIDEDNFIDYMVFMIYSGNHDWLNNNTRFWKERKDGAKWRWMLDDLDGAFLHPTNNTVLFAKRTYTFSTRLFNNLLKNSTFKQKLKDRFNYYLTTTFAEANMLKVINKVVNERKEYIKFERDAWNISSSKFNQNTETFKDFAKRRVAIVQNQLDDL